MNTQFTGIFGHVVSGIEALDKVADMGGDGGRPGDGGKIYRIKSKIHRIEGKIPRK